MTEREALKKGRKHIEGLQTWLADITPELEKMFGRRSRMATERS
jgi:hypothetical protein